MSVCEIPRAVVKDVEARLGQQDCLRALTLWRPWPHSIFFGPKRLENRPWRPRVLMKGDWFAIHAGHAWDQTGSEYCRSIGYEPPVEQWCQKGVIMGMVRYMGTISYAPTSGEQRKWFFGPFAWLLDSVVAFDSPIPAKGSQGLWILDEDTMDKVLTEFFNTIEKHHEFKPFRHCPPA